MNTFGKLREEQNPVLPAILEHLHQVEAKAGLPSTNSTAIEKLFPNTTGQPFLTFSKGGKGKEKAHRVGVVLSGGQAAGGHNVIVGLYDALKKLHPDSELIGFLNGPSGIIENHSIILTEDIVSLYRNQGGFDMIGSGRTKISTEEQFAASLETIKKHHLDGLVIIGGDDSNTNAALLAERIREQGIETSVVGVPKTIDGDLKNEHIEISFGFDTATKTYSHTIGNILRDALSAGKYYFFIKLMGRSASHIALECALQTHANYTIIGEEVAERGLTLRKLTDDICDMICARALQNKNFGAVLIPEGTIEFIPEVRKLIRELNLLLLPGNMHQKTIEHLDSRREKSDYVSGHLSKESSLCFLSMPMDIRMQLLMDRDPHGNVQVAKIETERLFIQMVKEELDRRKADKKYTGKFSVQPLFLGYEGRSCYPSLFDSTYCYALGHVAALLIDAGVTGYMASVQNLTLPCKEWTAGGIPITTMLTFEERHGEQVPVIEKALVDLKGRPFQVFKENRDVWKLEDNYLYPGPIQFFGPYEITEATTVTLREERMAGSVC
ncbi:MAG: diphosphate--fructose-6-phosphate 1-phosphotransferase [Chlamydiales bacterium]|nr:diphosphate--fructose-6-phosphate 1-phosphotransferase [Chlamydiia bacterium]MCP5508413.1 diphosphate--fructose-6-phosphate 1-phosphotransferase [Chlamydiales bacterium]